ncbi:MAG: hypothetical protein ACO1OQ_04955 [Rufibacter sp.]
MKSILVGMVIMLFNMFQPEAYAAVCRSIKSGKWSDPSVWSNGLVPGKTNRDDAIITSGTTVIVDIKVNGTVGKKSVYPIGAIYVEPNAFLLGDGTGSSEMNFGTDTGEDLVNFGTIDFSGPNRLYFNIYKSSRWGGTGVFKFDDIEITNGAKLTFTQLDDNGTPANFTVHVAGDFYLKQGNITLTPTVALNFNGIKRQIIPSGITWHTIYINNPNGVQLSENLASHNLKGDLHVQTGEFLTGPFSIEGNGNNIITVAAGAIFNVGTINNIYNGFPAKFKEAILDAASTVEYSANDQQTIFPEVYGNLVISGSRSGARVIFPNAAQYSGYDVSIVIQGKFLPEATFTTGGYRLEGSILHFAGAAAQTIPAFNYHDLLVSGNRGANSVTFSSTGTIGVAGAFTPTASFTSGGYITANSTISYNGAGSQTIAPFNYYNLASGSTGTRVLAANGVIQVAGAFTPGSNTYTESDHSIEFNGTAPQSIPVFGYHTMILSGGSTKTLAKGAIQVKNALTLKSGILSTGAFKVSIAAGGRVEGGSAASYVHGTLEKHFSTGSSVSQIFEIGTSTSFLPVTIRFPSVTTAGKLAITYLGGEHPSIVSSCLDETKSLNTYWKISSSGIQPMVYNGDFSYEPASLDSGVDVGKLVSGTFNGSWNIGTASTTGPSTINYPGITSTGEIIFAQAAVPLVTQAPKDIAVVVQQNTSFTASGTGKFLSYRWQINKGDGWSDVQADGIHSTFQTNSLTLTKVTADMDTYRYRLILTGACGPTDTSAVANLQVNTYPIIVAHPVPSSTCPGTASFKVEAASQNVTGKELAYSWQVSTNGGSTWVTLADGSVYNQTTTPMLAITNGTYAMNGYQYRCVVTGRGGLTTSTNSALLTVLEPLKLVSQPTGVTTCEAKPVSFGVTGKGEGLSFQWQVLQNGEWVNLLDSETYTGTTNSTLGLKKADLNLNGSQYRCVLKGTCAPNELVSNAATLKINPLGTWIASTGSWDIAENWCGGLPTVNTDVVIPAGELQIPNAASCRNLVVNKGASLSMASGASLSINGEAAIDGALVVGSGKVVLNGAPAATSAFNLITNKNSVLEIGGNYANASVPASVIQLKQLIINHALEVKLQRDLVVEQTLSFTKGKLHLTSANLTIGNNGSISGADSTRYIVTGNDPINAGFLVRQVPVGTSLPIVFPVGTAAAYAPAKIWLASGSSKDNFKVRVVDKVFTKGTSGESGTDGTVIERIAVEKTWFVEEEVSGGSIASLTFSWSVQEEGKAFRRTNCSVAHFTGGRWDYGTTFGVATPENGFYSATRVVTSFSPLAVVDNAVTNVTTVNTKLFLAGAYQKNSGAMTTLLNGRQMLPLGQPFQGAPFNYSGSEQVAPAFLQSHPEIVDWVLVELRESPELGSRLVRKACFIKSDGTLVDLDGNPVVTLSGVPSGNYYVLLHHRNHLPAISGAPVNLTDNSGLYDFTLSSARFMGGVARLLGNNVYGIHGGDANADGKIDIADVNTYWQPNNGQAGYLATDFNLDGETDNVDSYIIWRPSNGAKVPLVN